MDAETEVKVNVSDLGTAVNYNRISAILTSADNTVLCYGKATEAYGTGIGEYTFTIPAGVTGATKLYVFAEAVQDGNKTDYASNLVKVTDITPASQATPEKEDSQPDEEQPSSQKKTEAAYINPLTWNYAANQINSMCLVAQQ